MKTTLLGFLLVFLAPAVRAALLAHVQTDRGTIVTELQYDKAPQAVANFITMAQGTRPRIRDSNGAIIMDPLYVGEKFFRIINSGTFKIAQTGSGTGTNSGSPGFTFRDEFDPSLRHVPYVLSMANSGPNTNGGQIFFTGNVTIPWLDDVHTIFGLVVDVPSRAVIDAILAAGNGGTTITGITFTRTDPAAEAFDEFAQNLPNVFAPDGKLVTIPPAINRYDLTVGASTGDVVQAYSSQNLEDWTEQFVQHIGITPAIGVPVFLFVPLGDPSVPANFYHITQAHHPDSVAPSQMRNRDLTVTYGTQTHIYRFNGNGNAGTIEIQAGGPPVLGTFTLLGLVSGGHHTFVTVQTNLTYESRITGETVTFIPQFRCGWDSTTNALVSGRQTTSFYDSSITPEGFEPFGSGTCTVDR